MKEAPSLTRGQITRGLRAFITASGLWGAWGQATSLGTAVFTGFALSLGADESFIALCMSLAYLMAVTQVIFPLLGTRLKNRKRFIIGAGIGEILLRGAIILIPFLLAPSFYLGALLTLIALGLLCGYAASPFFSTWMADTIPAHRRAHFTSRQTIVSTIVGMIAGFLVGQFIDLFPANEKHQAFTYVFIIGTLFGLGGYFSLSRAPFPKTSQTEDSSGELHMLLGPFKDTNFRRAAMFVGLWTFAVTLSGSLFSVFMLKHLQISYTEISIFNALFMAMSIGGYKLWAGLVDRFGSKAVLQILLVPTTLIPFLWIFNEPGSYFLVPIALALSGLLFAGISVSFTPLLYGLLPEGEQKPFYVAAWSASINLLGALGPLCGSFLTRYLEDVNLNLAGHSIGNLQIIFALSAGVRIIPIFLLRSIHDSKGTSSRRLLSQMFSGNLLSYAFNATIYNIYTNAERRARATLALGKSGNPLAIEQLIQALADASPRVRRSAAHALGETGSELATEPLIKELLNDASDIRGEAAEALGNLGHASSIDPLIQALEDPDPRVRISAIRGLAGTKKEEAQELLFWYFSEDFNSLTFPTLVDVLSEMGDRRIVKPTLQRLGQFRSQAIRLQLLNSVCRAMGAGDQFYQLLSYEEVQQTSRISRLLKRASTTLTTSSILDGEIRQNLRQYFNQLIQAYEGENGTQMEESTRKIVGTLRDGFSPSGQPAYEVLSIFVVIVAINNFLSIQAHGDLPKAQDIFLTVCINRFAVLVRAMSK